jgi:hypothetical protein
MPSSLERTGDKCLKGVFHYFLLCWNGVSTDVSFTTNELSRNPDGNSCHVIIHCTHDVPCHVAGGAYNKYISSTGVSSNLHRVRWWNRTGDFHILDVPIISLFPQCHQMKSHKKPLCVSNGMFCFVDITFDEREWSFGASGPCIIFNGIKKNWIVLVMFLPMGHSWCSKHNPGLHLVDHEKLLPPCQHHFRVLPLLR